MRRPHAVRPVIVADGHEVFVDALAAEGARQRRLGHIVVRRRVRVVDAEGPRRIVRVAAVPGPEQTLRQSGCVTIFIDGSAIDPVGVLVEQDVEKRCLSRPSASRVLASSLRRVSASRSGWVTIDTVRHTVASAHFHIGASSPPAPDGGLVLRVKGSTRGRGALRVAERTERPWSRRMCGTPSAQPRRCSRRPSPRRSRAAETTCVRAVRRRAMLDAFASGCALAMASAWSRVARLHQGEDRAEDLSSRPMVISGVTPGEDRGADEGGRWGSRRPCSCVRRGGASRLRRCLSRCTRGRARFWRRSRAGPSSPPAGGLRRP